jgi:NAD(P)-dependent dehydrogenase (short-subunit alcohol dehydrogenase family)
MLFSPDTQLSSCTQTYRQNQYHAQVGPPFFASFPEEVANAKVQSVPMKRLGTPEEVVKSVSFLFSDDASYTTGINLVVDGGMAAGLRA